MPYLKTGEESFEGFNRYSVLGKINEEKQSKLLSMLETNLKSLFLENSRNFEKKRN